MTMSDGRMNGMLEQIREQYNVPDEAPREAMWRAISGRLGDAETEVIDLTRARKRRAVVSTRAAGWAVAAAVVLAFGVGIGRMTAPGSVGRASSATTEAAPTSLALVAQDHLGRTESLLTMVRADARTGRIDPVTIRWASGMLSQTRLLIDALDAGDPVLRDLLLDLELVLVQVVEVGRTGSMDEARARTEFALALRSLEEGEVLPRLQGMLPVGLPGT